MSVSDVEEGEIMYEAYASEDKPLRVFIEVSEDEKTEIKHVSEFVQCNFATQNRKIPEVHFYEVTLL